MAASGFSLAACEQTVSAECCDASKRTPRECFIEGLKEPKSNFIFERYYTSKLYHVNLTSWGTSQFCRFENDTCRKGTENWDAKILRGRDQFEHPQKGTQWHGYYRREVRRVATPCMSGAISWPGPNVSSNRLSLIKSLLNVSDQITHLELLRNSERLEDIENITEKSKPLAYRNNESLQGPENTTDTSEALLHRDSESQRSLENITGNY